MTTTETAPLTAHIMTQSVRSRSLADILSLALRNRTLHFGAISEIARMGSLQSSTGTTETRYVSRKEGLSRLTANPFNISIRSKMYDVRDILMDDPSGDYTLISLAHRVGTNECTLKKAFKAEFGTTVFGFLTQRRMELAMHYLTETKLPLGEIGVKLGYEHQSHFTTAFRRFHGHTPSSFRRGEAHMAEHRLCV